MSDKNTNLNTFTVAQLIAQLQTLPPDTPVLRQGCSSEPSQHERTYLRVGYVQDEYPMLLLTDYEFIDNKFNPTITLEAYARIQAHLPQNPELFMIEHLLERVMDESFVNQIAIAHDFATKVAHLEYNDHFCDISWEDIREGEMYDIRQEIDNKLVYR